MKITELKKEEQTKIKIELKKIFRAQGLRGEALIKELTQYLNSKNFDKIEIDYLLK